MICEGIKLKNDYIVAIGSLIISIFFGLLIQLVSLEDQKVEGIKLNKKLDEHYRMLVNNKELEKELYITKISLEQEKTLNIELRNKLVMQRKNDLKSRLKDNGLSIHFCNVKITLSKKE